jgi:hypothetical protein
MSGLLCDVVREQTLPLAGGGSDSIAFDRAFLSITLTEHYQRLEVCEQCDTRPDLLLAYNSNRAFELLISHFRHATDGARYGHGRLNAHAVMF